MSKSFMHFQNGWLKGTFLSIKDSFQLKKLKFGHEGKNIAIQYRLLFHKVLVEIFVEVYL